MKTTIACALALCTLLGCDSDFAPGSRISKLRLLAVRADQPFAAPEQTVALEPLLAGPVEAQPLSWAYATCSDPTTSTVESCLAELDDDFAPFDPQAIGLRIALGPAARYARTGLLGVALAACPGTIESGRTGNVPIRCLDASGTALPIDRFEVGVKRIFVREGERNENPSIAALTWDGEDWPEDELKVADACPARGDDFDACPQRLRHHIGIDTGGAERWQDEEGVSFDEQLVVQYYGTSGIFEREVRIAGDADNLWVPQRADPDDIASLWFVVRDNRGGVGWERRRVQVR